MTEKRRRGQIRLVYSKGESLIVSNNSGREARLSSLRLGMPTDFQALRPVRNFMAKLGDRGGLNLADGVQQEAVLLARLRTEEAEYGRRSPNLLESLRMLGLVNCLKGAYSRAESYFLRALNVIHGDEPEDMAARRSCLFWLISYVYVPQARLDEALEFAEEFASQGGSDEEVFNAFNNVCAIAYAEQNIALAFECIRHAIPFAKRFKALLPESLAQDFENAAGLAQELGKQDCSRSFMKRALELREDR